MSVKRRSLRDRDAAAIQKAELPSVEEQHQPQPVKQASQPVAAPKQHPRPERATPTRKRAKPAPREVENKADVSNTAKVSNDVGVADAVVQPWRPSKVGIYIHWATLDDAKSAYLVLMDDLPEHVTTFDRWVSACVAQHNTRSSEERAAAVEDLPPEVREGRGMSRAVELDHTVRQNMEQAIVADRKQGRVHSIASYITSAMRIAIEQARSSNGGVLPPAPARLPSRQLRG